MFSGALISDCAADCTWIFPGLERRLCRMEWGMGLCLSRLPPSWGSQDRIPFCNLSSHPSASAQGSPSNILIPASNETGEAVEEGGELKGRDTPSLFGPQRGWSHGALVPQQHSLFLSFSSALCCLLSPAQLSPFNYSEDGASWEHLLPLSQDCCCCCCW